MSVHCTVLSHYIRKNARIYKMNKH